MGKEQRTKGKKPRTASRVRLRSWRFPVATGCTLLGAQGQFGVEVVVQGNVVLD
jgi:hypothetical protein